jgi:hypothetical protein
MKACNRLAAMVTAETLCRAQLKVKQYEVLIAYVHDIRTLVTYVALLRNWQRQVVKLQRRLREVGA